MDIAGLLRGDFFPPFLPGNAMIHSSRRDRKTKAIAEVLAMMPDVHPELVPYRPRPVRETDEWLWESATEFCAAHKLARTFGAQVDALKRYRSGGEQTVRVEHVTVNEGGRAIVGNVSHGGRGSPEKMETSS